MMNIHVNLNKDEIAALICCMNYLSEPNEVYLQMNNSQLNRLYNKLYTHWEEINRIEKIDDLVGGHVG